MYIFVKLEVDGYELLHLENKYYAAINILAELYGDGSEKASTSKGSSLNKLLSRCESLIHQGKKMICIYSLLCNINNNSDDSRYGKTIENTSKLKDRLLKIAKNLPGFKKPLLDD